MEPFYSFFFALRVFLIFQPFSFVRLIVCIFWSLFFFLRIRSVSQILRFWRRLRFSGGRLSSYLVLDQVTNWHSQIYVSFRSIWKVLYVGLILPPLHADQDFVTLSFASRSGSHDHHFVVMRWKIGIVFVWCCDICSSRAFRQRGPVLDLLFLEALYLFVKLLCLFRMSPMCSREQAPPIFFVVVVPR